ncbi:MAG: putative oxidoreductase [Fimbriimonadaceae bacterium]|jgi:putative oxidoreductase|nr:putative oxidoreductase [Fimbriimonadaceae bacterium]
MNTSKLKFDKHPATELALFLLRVVAGLLFLQAGGMKLFGWFGGLPREMFPTGTAQLFSETGLAGILEFFGGIAIMLGLFTRPVAFILSGEMAVAYFQGHQPSGAWPIQNHGEPAVLLCFIFLYLAARGGGQYSLDAFIARRKKKAETLPTVDKDLFVRASR